MTLAADLPRAGARGAPWLALAALVGGGGLVGWWAGGQVAASLPVRSVQPAAVVLLAAVVVLVLVAMVVWWWSRQGFVDAATLEDAAGAPLLAHLQAPGDLTILPTLERGSTAAASFGHLRLVVDRQVGVPRPLMVVLAGLADDDLPVWVAANLAISLAGHDRRVLLVDGRLDESTGPTRSSTPQGPGLIGVLGGATLAEAATPGPVPGLCVLPVGRLTADDAALRGDRELGARLSAQATQYDVVVTLASSLEDSRQACSLVGSGLLVLALPEQQVRRSAVRDQARTVREAGRRLFGVVLVGDGTESVG